MAGTITSSSHLRCPFTGVHPGLKKWGFFVSKEKEQVRVVREDDSGKRDVIYCDHPVELIVTLLEKLGGTASVNQLCQVTNDDDLDF